ncbi:MAG: leucine-rich repeat domain-containing protein [Ruminococcaceae bacterium]|nr:leucine-rich repeat domain-containing protein [Oscillospiraceae bacterium]
MQAAEKILKIFLPVIKTDKYAFNSQIEDVEMLHTVKTVKSSAFCNCSSLKNIKFSDNLTDIQSFAFLNCSSLENVSLPFSIKSLGEGVFKSCTNLKKVELPKGLKNLPKSFFENCRALESIVLPEGLECIGEEAFSGCVNLKEIVFPKSLKVIKSKAFKRCKSLKSIVFPEGVKHIGDMAFDGCKALISIVFEGTLEYIGASAFLENPCISPNINGTMFSSSFIQKREYGLCPTVTVPKGIQTLCLGFENTLNYKQACENKTCYCHILSLEKYDTRLFISEHFYSYNDRNDTIIKNGEFDFIKYDSQFPKADEKEKAIISAFRLTYPIGLNEETEIIYKTHLSQNAEYGAIFATEKNEEKVLKYIIDNFDLDSEFCLLLYEKASKNSFLNLQQILSQKQKNTGFDEINFLYQEISG